MFEAAAGADLLVIGPHGPGRAEFLIGGQPGVRPAGCRAGYDLAADPRSARRAATRLRLDLMVGRRAHLDAARRNAPEHEAVRRFPRPPAYPAL